MLVGIAVGGLLLTATWVFFARGIVTNRFQYEQVLSTETARLQLERVSDVIRNARSSSTKGWLVEAGENSLVIYSNVDDDPDDEEVKFVISGNSLQRVITRDDQTEPTETIVSGIWNETHNVPVFTYYNEDGTEIAATGAYFFNVHRIGITLLVDNDPNQPPDYIEIKTDVFPRQKLARGRDTDSFLEATMEYPADNESGTADAVVTLIDPGTGEEVSSGLVPIADINSGRLVTYNGGYYTNLNHQPITVEDTLPGWYAWIGPIRVGQSSGVEYTEVDQVPAAELCTGSDIETMAATCERRTVFRGSLETSYQPILIYTDSDGRQAYVRSISFTYVPEEPPPPLSLSSGLVGYWKLDETSSPAVDSSGFDNVGHWWGNPVSTSDVAGVFTFPNTRSISLDGVDDYVNVSDSSSLNFSQTGGSGVLTISVWLKRNDLNKAHGLVTRWECGSGNANTEFQFMVGTDNKLAFTTVVNSTTSNHTVGNTVLDEGQWYHLAVTYNDSTKTGALYVNGAQDQSFVHSTSRNMINGTLPIRIGSRACFGGDLFLKGKIDDVRIYKRVLSGSEIADLANGDG